MKSKVFSTVFLILLLMSIGVPGHAHMQQPGDDLSIEASLARRKVALDKSSLIKALQNPDSTVRWQAATQLATGRDNDTIALIVAAEQDEKEPEAKTNMAYALAFAGNDEGFHTLRETCKADNQTLLIRLRAAKYLASTYLRKLEYLALSADGKTTAFRHSNGAAVSL